jgi:hypothetical protein
VAAVVVGALGGWARTTPEGLRVVDPGERVDATPFQIRLDRAEAAYEVSDDLADEGLAYVVVEGTLFLEGPASADRTVVGGAFAADLTSTYNLFGSPEEEGAPTTVYVAQDGSELLGLGPGLTYDVLLVWEIDEAAVPSEMTVALREHTWRPFFLDKIPGWFSPEPVARVTLDIAPLPDERPTEEDLL